MAKKSNKTEQVLKLLTKDEEVIAETIEEEQNQREGDREEIEPDMPLPEVEVSVKPKKPQELTYEAKLKIEIDPELAIKEEPLATEPNPIKEEEGKAFNVKGESKLIDQSDHLINLAEVLVKEKIDMVMDRLKVCDCRTCVNDIMAMTLNNLPTKYVTTDSGKQYLQLEIYKKQYETDVIAALTRACVRVKASPRHGE